jgi:hypothetical protein
LLGQQFIPSFTQGAVTSLVTALQSEGACSTFRVRSVVSPNEVGIRLSCAKAAYDLDVTVETSPPYRIAAITNNHVAPNPYCPSVRTGPPHRRSR